MLSALGDFARLAFAGFVFAREGVFALAPVADLPPGARFVVRTARLVERRRGTAEPAARLSTALSRLGPSYIKLGQFLATRRDVVGPDLATDLERLQDRLPPFPMDEARATIAASLDRPVETAFETLSEPVAAASIAQVHRARIEGTGPAEDVAVKVLRPDIETRFTRDLRSFYRAARLIERFVPPARRLRPIAVVDTLARSVALEMDLRLEAAAISEMAANAGEDPGFRVPRVDWARTTKRVLTIEWIDGIALSDLAAVRTSSHDLPALAETVIQTFLRHALRDGFFHADMHPGNLFLDHDGILVAVDFGIMGRLGQRERRFLAEILYGFIRRDYRRVAEVHFEAHYVPETQSVDDFAQALRAIGEPLQDRDASEISMARVLTQLFDVTELFAMRTQPQLILLQKTMVVVEGVARQLDPKVNMWHAAEPVVRQWIEGHLGVSGRLRDASRSALTLGRVVSDLPEIVLSAERTAERLQTMSARGLRLDDESIAALARAQGKASWPTRIALWVGALALLVMALR